mmetsp:Transcript_30393/g.80789  ORF Transcript_30393/g.80789 Transcript_30393/m.80789 type:complete len:89 (+) Transcript_30393:299-565(+)
MHPRPSQSMRDDGAARRAAGSSAGVITHAMQESQRRVEVGGCGPVDIQASGMPVCSGARLRPSVSMSSSYARGFNPSSTVRRRNVHNF